MTLFFVLLLVLPLGFVIWDIIGAEPEAATPASDPAPVMTAAEPRVQAAPRLTAAAAAGVAPVLRPISDVQPAPAAPVIAAQEAFVPAVEPRRYADTALSPEHAQILASLAAAYPASHQR